MKTSQAILLGCGMLCITGIAIALIMAGQGEIVGWFLLIIFILLIL